jgi:hypothetical protein
MDVPTAVAIAVTFVWLGMVLAISFLEAPLKFRAPGVTLPIGLGIGRLVFLVLNTVECVLAVVLVVTLAAAGEPGRDWWWPLVAVVSLFLQVALVRPRLKRRTDAVLASDSPDDVPRSSAHHWYIVTECAKVIGLVATGVVLLANAA